MQFARFSILWWILVFGMRRPFHSLPRSFRAQVGLGSRQRRVHVGRCVKGRPRISRRATKDRLERDFVPLLGDFGLLLSFSGGRRRPCWQSLEEIIVGRG